MLSAYDKQFLKALHKKLINMSNRRKIKKDIKIIFMRHRDDLSNHLQKFMLIRVLTYHKSKIFIHYTQSIYYNELMKEILKTIAPHCKNCDKLIIPEDKLTSISFLWFNKRCCNKQCTSEYGNKTFWEKAKKNPQLAKNRLQKIQATMLKRYGATTTLASKELNKKVWETRKKLYGHSGRKHD